MPRIGLGLGVGVNRPSGSGTPPTTFYLLLQTGDRILQQDGASKILQQAAS
jgi:hypothetical protein